MSSHTPGTPALTSAGVVRLRTQVPDGVLATSSGPVRLSWQVVASERDLSQRAYEVETAVDGSFEAVTATSGVVESPNQLGVIAPGEALRSREVRHHRVRVRTQAGWSPWSDSFRTEAGLLDASDWVAAAVTLPNDSGANAPAPAPLLRREFRLTWPVDSARLYITALGTYDVTINGRPVSDDLLAPGWTPYERRLIADTYDVTALLTDGPNVIAAMLGDGWYRGRIGWADQGRRSTYGTQVGLLAQLEIHLADGSRMTVPTDDEWKASVGAVRRSDFYDGCHIDLRCDQPGWRTAGFDDSGWQPVATAEIDRSIIEPRTAPPVRRIATMPITTLRRHEALLLDGGQNISGWVRLRVRGNAGDTVEVRHAEVLEPDGSMHLRSLRTARSVDTYILGDDREVELEPSFTFHGFQFAEVRTKAEVIHAEYVAISSAWIPRSTFDCAEPALVRLHENVVWSLRDNFVSLPTDCPQRDERLGWTGDAQVFAATASTLFDTEAFWASWLRDLELEQDDELGVPSVVPNVVLVGEPRFGRAGWGDAATIVPWSVYESYGDAAILRNQFDSMRRWVDSVARRRDADGLLGVEMQFGDWLDPNAPVERPWEARTDSVYLANAFLARSARLVANAASLLGERDVEEASDQLAREVATKTWDRWRDAALTTQTGCALALAFELAPRAERPAVAEALAHLVRDAGGRVGTGFLGTPLVLPALSAEGQIDAAYLMLLCRKVPSWLYQVDMGATTIWERWDAIRPDGSIHPGDMRTIPVAPGADVSESNMLSFNHYAYGAIVDWMYRNVAGLSPVAAAPGYREVIVSPKPVAAISWAKAAINSPYGRLAIDWRIVESDTLEIDLDVPFGTLARLVLPTTGGSTVTVDDSPLVADFVEYGRHHIRVTASAIALR